MLMVVLKILVLQLFPKKNLQKITRFLYRFVRSLNWEITRREKLCNDIEHGGEKTLDVKKYFLSLKGK